MMYMKLWITRYRVVSWFSLLNKVIKVVEKTSLVQNWTEL